MKHCGLVADAGGTNVRFALVDLDAAGATVLHAPRKFVSKQYGGMIEAAKAYLADAGCVPSGAVFAVAGPVRDGAIHLTNLGWKFSTEDIRAGLGVAEVELINDFEAVALSVPHLGASDLAPIGPDLPRGRVERETIAVMGPGTGFGVAGCVRRGGGVIALVTEGGHADFAPAHDVEIEILKFLRLRFGHVSRERILSGPGLVNLHEALAAIEGRASGQISPQEITARAMEDPDGVCAKVFARFCGILGSAAGDIVLTMGAQGGVMIAGGILPAMRDVFAASGFRERFEAKGRFADYMKAVPTSLILQEFAGLIGAAASLKAMCAAPPGDDG